MNKIQYKLPNNQKVEITVVSGNDPRTAKTTNSTILINEKLFTDYPKFFQDYAVAHEYHHQKSQLSYYFVWFMVVLQIISVVLLFSSILSLRYLTLLPMFQFFIWYYELSADFFAFDVIKLWEDMNMFEKVKGKVKISLIEKIINRWTHPWFWLTIRLYKMKKLLNIRDKKEE